jgi:hypothetical protein
VASSTLVAGSLRNSSFALDAAVDHHHGLLATDQPADLVGEVVQRVLVLGEDDELALAAIGVAHFRRVLQQPRQFVPLAVLTAVHHLAGLLLQRLQAEDFCLQLDNGLRRGCLVDHGFLELFVVLGRQRIGGFPHVFGGPLLSVRRVGLSQLAGGRLAAGAQLLFLNPAGELDAAALERLVDGLWAGRQPALQRGKGEAHRALAVAVLQLVGPVHLLLDVSRDGFVQGGFQIGQLVVDRAGDALGEQRRAVELQQVFLDHAAHEISDVNLVGAVAELAVEAVAVQQAHEQLEVFFLAVVRRGRHQQQVAGDAAQQFAQLEALSLVDLVSEVAGRELVRLIDHHQVPVRKAQLVQELFAARQLVYAGDHQVGILEGVTAALLHHLAAEEAELQAELLGHFVLPLLDQASRGHDQHAPGVGAHQQFSDQQAGHDGFAGAGVVSQHVAQRLARQHRLVDCSDLVRQRFHVGRVNRHHRVE